jgi:dihydroorotase
VFRHLEQKSAEVEVGRALQCATEAAHVHSSGPSSAGCGGVYVQALALKCLSKLTEKHGGQDKHGCVTGYKLTP